jgi:hypothetical protein
MAFFCFFVDSADKEEIYYDNMAFFTTKLSISIFSRLFRVWNGPHRVPRERESPKWTEQQRRVTAVRPRLALTRRLCWLYANIWEPSMMAYNVIWYSTIPQNRPFGLDRLAIILYDPTRRRDGAYIYSPANPKISTRNVINWIRNELIRSGIRFGHLGTCHRYGTMIWYDEKWRIFFYTRHTRGTTL